MSLRHLTFLKIAREDFSDIIVDREFHADRVRLKLMDGSWIDVRYPVEENVPPEEPCILIRTH
jgi:hypothetical protein